MASNVIDLDKVGEAVGGKIVLALTSDIRLVLRRTKKEGVMTKRDAEMIRDHAATLVGLLPA